MNDMCIYLFVFILLPYTNELTFTIAYWRDVLDPSDIIFGGDLIVVTTKVGGSQKLFKSYNVIYSMFNIT